MSSKEQHIDFVGREITLLTNFILSQLPKSYGIQFHADKALESISYRTSDNKRKTLGPWIDAPGYRPKDASRDENQTGKFIDDLVDQAPIRTRILAEMDEHQKTMQHFIPQCVASNKIQPLTDNDIAVLKEHVDKKQVPCAERKLAYSYRKQDDIYANTRMRLAYRISGAEDPIEESNDKGDEGEDDKPEANPDSEADLSTEKTTPRKAFSNSGLTAEDEAYALTEISDDSDDERSDTTHTSLGRKSRKRARSASIIYQDKPSYKRTCSTAVLQKRENAHSNATEISEYFA
ncbi:hypothetical protein BDN70DRAFT_938300 [Pholiota conissans]|uniref:Uncharacterized protein n=1 Tax=Pholiota conissans TaxID=109636 RepID=A0A9P5YMZ6_9AGAR|nr:hypothetical protein BDN70DRAFT_938300 [Pholiota conissans]